MPATMKAGGHRLLKSDDSREDQHPEGEKCQHDPAMSPASVKRGGRPLER